MAEPEDTGPMDEGMDGMEGMGGMEGDMDGMDMEPGMGMEEDDMGQQGGDMSLDEMIVHVERQMREYERNAQYLEAEKARQHLLSLKKKKQTSRQRDLEAVQQEDVRVFLDMVQQHQESFDRTWEKKILEHKMRADDLIDALKWKHDDQQRELYELLRKKRMPKFSVELLNLRKKQVLLARNKKYIQAEKVKRKADILEAFEIDNIRRAAKEENQLRFKALLKRQHWDRQALADKLGIEKKQLLEAKAQDFERLKKRLKNAEAELKKTHIRQALQADKKLAPLYSTLPLHADPMGGPSEYDTKRGASRTTGAKVYSSSEDAARRPRRNARDLANSGREEIDSFAQGDLGMEGYNGEDVNYRNPYDEDDSLTQFAAAEQKDS